VVRPTASIGYQLIDGFPEYALGAKVVATGTASTGAGVIRVTAVTAALGFVLATRCKVRQGADLLLTWTANGNEVSSAPCGATSRPDPNRLPSTGEPVEFVVTIASAKPGPMPDGSVSVAVMSRVDYADYPLPPRPAKLAALPTKLVAGRDPRIIDSIATDPDAPVEIKLTVVGDTWLDMVAQTPGYLRVYANGSLQDQADWWDYEQLVYSATLPVGTRLVTLRFVPEHMTGAWRAFLYSGQT
jgi:hypothetical protein